MSYSENLLANGWTICILDNQKIAVLFSDEWLLNFDPVGRNHTAKQIFQTQELLKYACFFDINFLFSIYHAVPIP